MHFPVDYQEILDRISDIDPLRYQQTRNFTSGAVSRLSPYISRGVITSKQVIKILEEKGYCGSEMESLLQQLAWREYFQRSWQYLEDGILSDIRTRYTGIRHSQLPVAIKEAHTGITEIDEAIKDLYTTGYLHNHLRLYIASIVTNIGHAHWLAPSQWMYYHLLDGDIASNNCSWQWVAGTFSSKQYYCNQENINRFTGSKQENTFLDRPYEDLKQMQIPPVLSATIPARFETVLPEKDNIMLDSRLPLLLYNSYNLSPSWHAGEKANRVLVLEPSHFRQFPVSERVLQFIMELSKNIPTLQVWTGEIHEIPGINDCRDIRSLEHPAFHHWPGMKEEREWLFPEVNGRYNSFHAFWKKCQPYITSFLSGSDKYRRA